MHTKKETPEATGKLRVELKFGQLNSRIITHVFISSTTLRTPRGQKENISPAKLTRPH